MDSHWSLLGKAIDIQAGQCSVNQQTAPIWYCITITILSSILEQIAGYHCSVGMVLSMTPRCNGTVNMKIYRFELYSAQELIDQLQHK